MLFPVILAFVLQSRNHKLTPRSSAVSAIKLRRAEIEDVQAIELLALDVFGESKNTGFDWLTNEILRRQVSIGFNARISAASTCNFIDYNVFCMVEDDKKKIENDPFLGLRGVIEVSMQPKDGERAGMMPASIQAKIKASSPSQPLRPYISNLVVDSRFRRQGFAKRLVRVCEERAVAWGYSECLVHVDVEETAAVALYDKLGYETVKEDPAWMKFFTGVQLRYLSKPVIAGVN
mmetsp:Transcript_85741/g.171630  ORF Transcript_85741/g.171630 Transcript_85741/m.171630 type:complete len:234 (+) Transcript_85741:110-811(+)